jgi:hypothetical protein
MWGEAAARLTSMGREVKQEDQKFRKGSWDGGCSLSLLLIF